MLLSDIIILGIELIFYVFHFSVLFILIIYRKSKFSGAFFNMLRMLFFSDIFIFISSFESRLPTYGLWREFFESDKFVAKLQLISVGYLLSVQFLIHAFIPFNRFTLFWLPFAHKRIWQKQWYTVVILVIPMLLQIPWIQEPAVFIYTKSGLVVLTYMNLNSMAMALFFTFAFSSLMTLIAAIFNILAVIKYIFHKYSSPDLIQLKEITFLYMSCALFLFHCIYCLTIVGRTVFTSIPIIAYLFQSLSVIAMDIIAWSGSISLLIISKYSRKTYFYYFQNIRDQKQPNSVKISTVSRAPITQIT